MTVRDGITQCSRNRFLHVLISLICVYVVVVNMLQYQLNREGGGEKDYYHYFSRSNKLGVWRAYKCDYYLLLLLSVSIDCAAGI